MEDIKTIIVSSFTIPSLIIAYKEGDNERNFKLISSDDTINGKIISRNYILSYICEVIDKKLISKGKQYGIFVKKVDNTIIILFNKMEITHSYYDEKSGFFIFPRIMLNRVKLISVKQFYGDKLDNAKYHVRSSADRWIFDNDEKIICQDVRIKLYKMILESILIKNYKVSVDFNIYSEVLIDIQSKADYKEEM